MKSKILFLAAGAILSLAACTKETSQKEGLVSEPIQTIKVNVASFDADEQTKVAVTPEGGFTWSAGDQIGIYPLSVGDEQTSQQIIFKVNGGDDASSASFTGTGWGLITNGDYSYFSYYPYDELTTHDEAVVTYTCTQNQESNSSTSHLGVNDYLYAPAVCPQSATSAEFTFYHLSALLELEITVPEDKRAETFKYVTLSAEEPLFTVSGKYNPSTTTADAKPALTDNVYTDKLSLSLNGTTGFVPDADGKIHAYFLVAPAAVKDKTLTLRLTGSDNKLYLASKKPSSNIESQNHKIYQFAVELKPDTQYTDLSQNGTANCYIVPEYGSYKFLANIRGNGYDPFDTENHAAGAPIDLTSLHAEVLWESYNSSTVPAEGAIISDVQLEVEYITFKATGNPGNAVISLKDSSNDDAIVWSWHIWSTNADLEGEARNLGGYTAMDRNLGALSVTDGGLGYEWGRPWPFHKESCKTTSYGIWQIVAKSDDTGTLAYSDANPTTYINSGTQWTFWGTFTNPGLWGSNKTMYDPCPLGWIVMPIALATKTPINDETVYKDSTRGVNVLTTGQVETLFPLSTTVFLGGFKSSWFYLCQSSKSYFTFETMKSGGMEGCLCGAVRAVHE